MASSPNRSLPARAASQGRKRSPARQALQRWTNHLALWVAVGGALTVTHCHRRQHAIARTARTVIDEPIPLLDIEPSRLELAPRRSMIRHVVGL